MSFSEKEIITKKGMKTRKRILSIAEEVFGEKGYFEASVSEITLKAGVAQGTFYNYFPTKKAIFDELIYQLSSDLRLSIKQAMERQEGFEKKQRAGYRAFFEWVDSHRNLYSIVQQAVLVDMGIYRWYYEKIAEGFVKSISAALEAGECKNLNPETVAYCLMGIGQFIGMRWILWEEGNVPEGVFEEVMDLVFHGVLSKGE